MKCSTANPSERPFRQKRKSNSILPSSAFLSTADMAQSNDRVS
jgi:hypothetical protein